MSRDPARARELKAKYLDWCSARLADRFLQLTPEAIYELALEAERRDPPEALSGGGAASITSSYRSIVGRVTDVLADRLGLPGFAEWAAAYERDPAPYDEDLLGMWKEGVPV